MKTEQPAQTPGGHDAAIAAFHLMWDAFPFLVLLLQRDRTILAANRMAIRMGAIPGMKCYQWHKVEEIHEHCLGNAALDSGRSMRRVLPYRGMVLDSYWIPVGTEDELMIHFSIDITPYAKPELLQEST